MSKVQVSKSPSSNLSFTEIGAVDALVGAYEDIHITSSTYSGGFNNCPNTRSNCLHNELVEQESSSGFIPDESNSDSSTEIEIPSSS